MYQAILIKTGQAVVTFSKYKWENDDQWRNRQTQQLARAFGNNSVEVVYVQS